MKKKFIVGIICLIVFIGTIFTTIMIINNRKDKQPKEDLLISKEPVTDECTDEYNRIAQQTKEVQEVNSEDEKISANSALILKKYYKACGHTINEYVEMLPELVNMTQDEVDEKFIEWELIGFSSREVTLFKEFDGVCGEHFRLKEENGKVIIYKVLEDETEQIYEKTQISTEFLTETDLLQMQSEKGIEVFGKEELNKVLEDFE